MNLNIGILYKNNNLFNDILDIKSYNTLEFFTNFNFL